MIAIPTTTRPSARGAALVLLATLAACGGGERNRAAACGIAQLAGPAIVQQQLDNARQLLTAAPIGLPGELPARVVGQREARVAVSYVDERLAASYTGDGFPVDPQVGFGLLVVDDTSQRVVGILIYDAVAPKGRPELGYVTGGERSVPLFGVRVSWIDVSNPRCPLLGDTAQAGRS